MTCAAVYNCRKARHEPITNIEVAKIKRARFGVRAELGDVEPLAQSIKSVGLLSPLLVRPLSEGSFELISGHRRLAACISLGMERVPCTVLELNEKQAYETSLVENVQRRSLNPIEEAMAYYLYICRKGWGGASELARKIGKSKEYVSHRIMLLHLPEEVKQKIASGALEPSKATELAWLKDESSQVHLAEAIIRDNLSHRQVRGLVRAAVPRDSQTEAEEMEETLRPSRLFGQITQAILMLRRSLWVLDDIIESLDEADSEPALRACLLDERLKVHNVIDRLLSCKRAVERRV